jgi:hypothetical protein
MKSRIKKVNKRLDKTLKIINHKYTPREVLDLWNGKKITPHSNTCTCDDCLGIGVQHPKLLVFDGAKYHKVITFTESDGHQFADSIEFETDENSRWRVKHYQDRWMEKKDMIKFYELILNVIKKL